MAQVATVYWIEPWPRTAADVVHTLRGPDVETKRPRPVDKRVWASVEKQPRKVIRAAFEEALRRDPDKRHRWIVLVDGEPKQLRAVKAEARRVGVKTTILVDIVHVLEYVWKAARAIFGASNPEAEAWVGNRLLSLLTGRTGGQVAATIRRWADNRKEAIDDDARKQIAKACKYMADRTRTRLMHYEQALQDGLPIATGVVEGACRYLVKDRMDRPGARWGSQALKQCCGCARSVPRVTSTHIGNSTWSERECGTTHPATTAETSQTLYRSPSRGSGGSSSESYVGKQPSERSRTRTGSQAARPSRHGTT